jgi:hypothetical protein
VWVIRELSRFLFRISFGAALAILVAGVWALASGSDFAHSLRIMLFLFGALLLMLAGAGNRASATNRRLGWLAITPSRGNVIARWSVPRPEDPQLTASAVFVGSGAVLIVLGFVV